MRRCSQNVRCSHVYTSCVHCTQCVHCIQCEHCLHFRQVYHSCNVSSFSGMAGSTAMACIHCKKTQAVVEMTQDRNRKWVCWQCSYPACSGCGERCPTENTWRLWKSRIKVFWSQTGSGGPEFGSVVFQKITLLFWPMSLFCRCR